MIEAMDSAIGRLLDALDERGLTQNTLVVFTSDNGGFSGVADNRPLRESKGHLYEGGIRVPLIVRWPGVVQSGTICETPVISMDYYPTLAEVAGLTTAAEVLDGVSILPLLNGNVIDRDSLFFHYPNYAWHRSNRLGGAIRQGRFKLVEDFHDGSVELYDLENDLSERQDLSAEKTALADRLQAQLADWRQRVGAAMPVKLDR